MSVLRPSAHRQVRARAPYRACSTWSARGGATSATGGTRQPAGTGAGAWSGHWPPPPACSGWSAREGADLTSASGAHAAAGRKRCGRLVRALAAVARLFQVEHPVRAEFSLYRWPRGSRRSGAGAWSGHRPPPPACSTWNTRFEPSSSLPVATGQPAGAARALRPAQGRSAPRPFRAERLSPGTRLRWVVEPIAPRVSRGTSGRDVSRGTSGRDVSRGTPLGARRA
jgi:hypothetical protein